MANSVRHFDIESYQCLPQSEWQIKQYAQNCKICNKRLRSNGCKHNCRHCGQIVCNDCSLHRINRKYRLCNDCATQAAVCKRYLYRSSITFMMEKVMKSLNHWKLVFVNCPKIIKLLLIFLLVSIPVVILAIIYKDVTNHIIIVVSKGLDDYFLVWVRFSLEKIGYFVSKFSECCVSVAKDGTALVYSCLSVIFGTIATFCSDIHFSLESKVHIFLFDIITINIVSRFLTVISYILAIVIIWYLVAFVKFIANNKTNTNNFYNCLYSFFYGSVGNSNKVSKSDNYEWQWWDDDGQYKPYNKQISIQIENLAIGESINQTIGSWTYIITKNTLFSATQQNTQTNKIRNVARKDLSYLDEFEDNSSLFIINDGDLSHKDSKLMEQIRDDFWKTMGKLASEIVKIQKCQNNNAIYEAYIAIVKNKCQRYNERTDNLQKFLWHGSSYDKIKQIIRTGFDRSFCQTYAYGKGVYFGVRASLSDGYSTYEDGYKYLLYCQVFTGHSAMGSSSYLQMPRDVNGWEYDSLVNHTSQPDLYVVARDYHAIPLFVVKYKPSKYGY